MSATETPNATRVSPYWRSLDDLEQTPEFQEFVKREFPQQAEDIPEGVSRRRWMQIMGASFTLAGVQGCRWQTEKIVPFADRPDGYVPGAATKFATSVEWGGASRHLLVTCYDGRPIKVEGNPEHPGSLGAAEAFSQAATLSLYDPDRQSTVLQRSGGKKISREAEAGWAEFDKFLGEQVERLLAAGGAGLGLLMPPSTSATVAALLAKISAAMPEARFYQHTAVSRGNELAGAELAFGKRVRTHYKLAGARVIAAFDSDLLHDRADSLAIARGWADSRDVDAEGFEADKMSRLYSVESQFTSTGSVADHRIAVKSSEIAATLAELRDLVKAGPAAETHDPEGHDHGDHDHHEAGEEHADAPSKEEFLAVLASDLLAAKGASLVAVGAHQPAEAHALAHEINALLENAGKTVVYTDEPTGGAEFSPIDALVGDMAARKIDTLMILGGNPVFDAPAELAFGGELEKVASTVHLSPYDDETSRLCAWSLPETHPFEAWGDAVAWDGTPSVGQPLIEPLLNGRSAIELLAALAGETDAKPQDLVREAVLGEAEDKAWKQFLHDGFIADAAAEPVSVAAKQGVEPPASAGGEGLEVVFRPSPQVYDGRFANNGWLQETPEFITKLTWDNAAIVSPKTAAAMNAKQGEMVRLSHPELDVDLDLPVFVVPGTAEGTIAVALGYGRTAAGRVGGYVAEPGGKSKYREEVVGERGNWGMKLGGGIPLLSVAASPVGQNVYPFRTSRHTDIVPGVTSIALGKKYLLATTQDHFSIDEVGLAMIEKRTGELVREGTIEDYENHEDFAKHVGHHVRDVELWDELDYNRDPKAESSDGRAWGMAIDLNKCLGCNACVVACTSENNVPVVGKDQVARGREMHWIRIDRYFHGPREAPQVAYQPVACQQCETAPCEQVCPVAATVHSDEGLNDMVYNRCIGTRYCANNCPFKVRRFNFFSYTSRFRQANNELLRLVNNPEVTLRSRGVMEKCTYCTQRIAAARIKSKTDGRAVPGKIEDGEIVTACQQACPTNAITFGDLNDKSSKVAAKHASPRSYGMLDGLRLKPRTQFLARIRNPHPKLAKYYPQPGGAHGGGHDAVHGGGHEDDHHHDDKKHDTADNPA